MSAPRPKVVYWNHSPTPYFVERFNAVVERGSLDFEAWFNERREANRSWRVDERDWRFRARYIPVRSLLGWHERVPAPELREVRPDVLVQEYDRGHLTAGFLAGRALAGRTAFRVLPNFDSWSERTWWREAGKQFVFRAVDAVKVPGNDGAALAERYGVPEERIERVTQSVDVDRILRARSAIAPHRARRRAELGLEGCVFIYVGRLWSGKGLDDLFEAYEGLSATATNCSLLLLGDGLDEKRLKRHASRLPRVVFAGFIQAAEIADYYGLADVMVFPTLGDPHGLVVEEAMVAGLPVIASAAAGDIATRLPDGEAGFVTPPHDARTLQERMVVLARDASLRARMGARAAELASLRDHHRYAAEFERLVTRTMERPARTTWPARAARGTGHMLSAATRAQFSAALITPPTRDDDSATVAS
jgi:glycosyltransferase involved in cell wall biosynthesis